MLENISVWLPRRKVKRRVKFKHINLNIVRESPKRPSFRKKYQESISMQNEAILVISSPSLPTTNNLRTRKIMTAAASSSTTYRFCNCCAPSNYLMKRVTLVAPVTHLLVGFQDLATVRDIWSRQNLFSAS